MDEKDFADFDEEEFEMLINGLIHPGDMFVSPDFMGGAFPPPIGGPGGMPSMPGMGGPASFANGYDSIIAQAYDEEEEAEGL